MPNRKDYRNTGVFYTKSCAYCSREFYSKQPRAKYCCESCRVLNNKKGKKKGRSLPPNPSAPIHKEEKKGRRPTQEQPHVSNSDKTHNDLLICSICDEPSEKIVQAYGSEGKLKFYCVTCYKQNEQNLAPKYLYTYRKGVFSNDIVLNRKEGSYEERRWSKLRHKP